MTSAQEIAAMLDDDASVVTSIRMPRGLRDAAAVLAAQTGLGSATAFTLEALRNEIDTVLLQRALDDHVVAHPEHSPTLVGVALALAALDGHPLAGQVAAIQRAAEEVVLVKPDADADDVLLWALARRIDSAAA